MKRRCTHEGTLRRFTVKSGEVMTRCMACNFGTGHYDQRVPLAGKLYRKGGWTDVEADVADAVEQTELETSDAELEPELQPLTFSALTSDAVEGGNTEYSDPDSDADSHPEISGEEEANQ